MGVTRSILTGLHDVSSDSNVSPEMFETTTYNTVVRSFSGRCVCRSCCLGRCFGTAIGSSMIYGRYVVMIHVLCP